MQHTQSQHVPFGGCACDDWPPKTPLFTSNQERKQPQFKTERKREGKYEARENGRRQKEKG